MRCFSTGLRALAVDLLSVFAARGSTSEAIADSITTRALSKLPRTNCRASNSFGTARWWFVALAVIGMITGCSSPPSSSEDAKTISERVTSVPDLVVTAISVSPANLAIGQQATFSATVKNQGTAATPAGVIIGVSFTIDGTQVSWSDTDTQSLLPGQSVTVAANSGPSGVSTWLSTAGNHTLQAWVDDVNRITESDETNNKFSIPLNIGVDLVVTGISVSPAGVAPSQPATFSATVKNQGTVATPAGVIIGIGFAVDGTTVSWSDLDTQSLAPGQSVTLTANSGPSGIPTWTATGGNHTLRAWVDDVNRIAETDETNNQLTIPLNITSDLVVTSVTASPSNVAPGQLVTFSATVKNQGSNATPPGVIIGVAFSVDGTKVTWSDSDTQSLAPGQSVTLTANSGPTGVSTWSATSGPHTIQALVDDVNRIVESDETNNQLSVPLSIGIDLTVTAVAPTTAPVGSSITFSVTVKNVGTSATPPGVIIGVAFAIDGTTVTWSDRNTQSLQPGQSVSVVANSGPTGQSTWIAASGNHTLQAWVDDVNRMADVDRSNNKLVTSFTSQASGGCPLGYSGVNCEDCATGFVSHGGGCVLPNDGSTSAHLSGDQARILGFENLADWSQTTGSAALSLSTEHVDLQSSLELTGVVDTKLQSVTFTPIAGGFSSVDIWVKNLATDTSTTGTVTLGFNAASGEPINGIVGQAVLQPPTSSFQQYTLAVPEWVNTALSAQNGAPIYATVELTFPQASNVEVDAITPHGAATDQPTPPFTQVPSDAQAIVGSASPGSTVAAGRIRGASGVDASGAFTYDVPLELPPGRAGMEPHLGLHYASSAGNGPLGVGWTVSGTSTISRCPNTVAREGNAQPVRTVILEECGSEGPCPPQFQQYDTRIDNFCLDGQKLVPTGGTATSPEFRTERDSFSRIVATYSGDFWPAKFTVSRKDGTVATYNAGAIADGFAARDTNGQPFAGAQPYQSVLSWPIATLEDRFGNAVSYSYIAADQGSAANLPDSVRYTTCTHGSCQYGGATRLVKFNYLPRSDVISAWSGGLSRSISLLLGSIAVSTLSGNAQTLVRTYVFGYDTSASTMRARLNFLTEKDAQGVPLPATRFTWGGGKGSDYRLSWHIVGPDSQETVAAGQCSAGNLAPRCFWATYEPYSNGPLKADPDQPVIVADFDGNGSDDVIVGLNDESDTNQQTDYWLYLSHPAHGTATFEAVHLGTGIDFSNSQAVDLDQDGTAEIVRRTPTETSTSANPVYRYQPSVRNFVPLTRPGGTTPFTIATTGFTGVGNPVFMDANGDGVLDVLYDTGFQSTLVGGLNHSYVFSLAVPNAHSLFPDSYTSPLEIFYGPNQADQDLYAQNLCHLEPIDYTGRGAASPAVVCDATTTFTRFPDLNGDGLADMLQASVGPTPFARERLSTGVVRVDDNGQDAIDPATQMLPPIDLATSPSANDRTDPEAQELNKTADLNGDGLADIVQFAITGSQAPILWLSSGVSAAETQVISSTQLPHTGDRIGLHVQQVGDFNGDGLPDIMQGIDREGVGPDGLTDRSTLQFMIQDPSNRDDIITAVNSDSIDLAKVTYKAATTVELGQHPDGVPPETIPGAFNPTRGLNVVSHADLVKGNAIGHYDYFYSQPAADTSGRGFLGFEQIVTADVPRASRTTTSYEGTRLEGSLHGYHVYPYAFVPHVVETLTGPDALDGFSLTGAPSSSVLVTRTETSTTNHTLHLLNSTDGTISATTSYFVEDSSSSNDKDDENNQSYYVASRAQGYDDFGNITGYIATSGPEVTVNTASYSNDSSANWLIGRLLQSKTTHARGGTTGPASSQNPNPATINYTYGSVGELRTVQYIGPTGAASETDTTITRDAAGLVRAVVTHDQSGNERASLFDLSADGVYREHTQDALGHDTWTGYHGGLGVPLISFDANGRETLYTYDGFGRLRSVAPTRGATTSITYSQSAGEPTISTTNTPGTTTRKLYDPYGNVSDVSTIIGGRTSIVSMTYDGLGRLSLKSQAHFIDGTDPGGNTTYTYDNLNEVRQVQQSDGTLVTVNRPDVLTTEILSNGNPARRTVVTKTDDGLVSSVREYSATGAVPMRGTDYVYGQGQELDQVSELNGTTTTYFYDGLPKPSEIDNPERGRAVISYTGFNDVSHVQNTSDNSTLDYQYDALGRVTKLSTNSPSSNPQAGQAQFVYDSGPGAIGQLAYSLSPDGVSTQYSYTPESLLAEVEYSALGVNYSTGYTYDPANGRLTHIDYPDAQNGLGRFGVDFNYDGGDGSLQSVTRGDTTYWSALSRGPTGIAEDTALLGGLTQSLTIEGSTRRLRGIAVNSPTATVYDVGYSYYPGGDIQQRTDSLAGTTDTYTYDGYDQLLSWSSTSNAGSSTENYVYDDLGNQTSTGSVTKTFGGAELSPDQIATRTKAGETRTYGYDFLGRRTSVKVNGTVTQTVAYTPFDLPSSIVTSSPERTHRYKYDANQHKFDENDGTFETTYVGELFERRVDNAACKTNSVFYVFADGQRVAQVDQVRDGSSCIDSNTGVGTVNSSPGPAVETTRVLHADLHGTPTAASTITPTLSTARQAFSPWGERLPLTTGSQSSSIDQVTVGFTDQEQDDSVGLTNMGGRVYDPSSRTFLTPDPIIGQPLSVLGWNKYAYTLNNPLRYVDPSGFDPVIGFPDAGYGASNISDDNEGIQFFLPGDADKARIGPSKSAFASSSDGSDSAGRSPVAARGGDTQSNSSRSTDTSSASGTGSSVTSNGNSTDGDAPLGDPVAPTGAPDPGASVNGANDSFNAGASTSQNVGPSLGGTLADIGLGFIPFASEIATIASDTATDDQKGWALVGMLVTAATLGISTEVKGAARATMIGDDVVESMVENDAQKGLSHLPDDALVCRGGTCTADRWAGGSGVTLDEAGRIEGASVNSAPGASVEELTTTIPNKQVGVTTVGRIRGLGGDVVPSGNAPNPFHCTMCGITPAQAEQLFTPTIRNPSVP
jgi:RHS repeat-associated protein